MRDAEILCYVFDANTTINKQFFFNLFGVIVINRCVGTTRNKYFTTVDSKNSILKIRLFFTLNSKIFHESCHIDTKRSNQKLNLID